MYTNYDNSVFRPIYELWRHTQDMRRAMPSALEDVEVGPIPFTAKLVSLLPCFLPCMACNSCYVLQPREEAAILHLGVLTSMQGEAGCHCTLPFGMQVKKVSTKQRCTTLPDLKVADASGSPVLVSAVLNYLVSNAQRAILNVQSLDSYVRTNAQAVLKQVVGSYTYDQLKTESSMINDLMLRRLEALLECVGVSVQSMQLNELNYAPEIASGMLKKQQAGALIEARKLIVEGAVMIAQDAVRMLEADATVTMNNEDKVKLMTNLLTVTCSDTDATPTLSV